MDVQVDLAVAQLRAEKARAAVIARERQREARRAAAARGHYVKPLYRFDTKTGTFIERVPRSSNPTELEINHRLYTWPALAGEFSGPALRRAGRVWQEAKEFYRAEDEAARDLARKRAFADGRYWSWAEFLAHYQQTGRSREQAEAAWTGRGLRLPPARRRIPADEQGDLERIGAIGTGRIGGREPKPEKPRKAPFRGDFVADFAVGERRARLVPARVGGELVFASEPETLVSEEVERGLQDLPPARAPRRPPPVSRSPFGSFAGSGIEHLEPEVAETKWSSPATPTRSSLQTPMFAQTTVASPSFSSSASPRFAASAAPPALEFGENEVDRAIRAALPRLKFESMTGEWRLGEDGRPVPWRFLVTSGSYDDYSAKKIVEANDDFLKQLYFGGWKPKDEHDFFGGRTEGGKFKINLLSGRNSTRPLLIFVENFWKRFRELYKALPTVSAKLAMQNIVPSTNISPMPNWLVEKIRTRNPTVSVFSPEFWKKPKGSLESDAAYERRLAEDAQRLATESFTAMRTARGV